MATRTFTTTGNFSDSDKWADGLEPGAGDTVVIADGVVCTINVNTPSLAHIGTAGTAGTGRCELADGVTVTFEAMEAGACGSNGFFLYEGTAAATLAGTVVGGSGGSFAVGCRNKSTGTLNITGDCTGGSFNYAYGSFNSAGGTINITGDCTGGSSNHAYGTLNNAGGTLNITGDCTGGSSDYAYGSFNIAGGTINIGGDSTGGSGLNAYGSINNAAGTLNIIGDSIGTTAIGAYQRGSSNAAGTIHIHGKVIGGATYGVYIHSDSRGRAYFYDELEDGTVVAARNNAGTSAYCFLGYGKQWLDNASEPKELPSWLITAEVENVYDLQMIQTAGLLEGRFVQTDDITIVAGETVANGGMSDFVPIDGFAGEFTGYDTGTGIQHSIENIESPADATFNGLFEETTATAKLLYIQMPNVAIDVGTGFSAVVLCLVNAGLIFRCWARGSVKAMSGRGLVAINNGEIEECYARLTDGTNPVAEPIADSGTGTTEKCYHNREDATHGVYVIEASAKNKSAYAGFDFARVWNIDKTETLNDGYPYLDGRSASAAGLVGDGALVGDGPLIGEAGLIGEALISN